MAYGALGLIVALQMAIAFSQASDVTSSIASLTATVETLQRQVLHLQETVNYLQQQEEVRANNVVAFSAYAANEFYNYGAGATVAFESVLLNEGNAYDSSLSTFTCPVTGIYWFTVTGYVKDEHDYYMFLSKAGEQVVGVHGTSNAHVMSSNSATVRCEAGQGVWVQMNEDNGEIYGLQSSLRVLTFSGSLLQIV